VKLERLRRGTNSVVADLVFALLCMVRVMVWCFVE
jgi:hypothetical protein